MTMNVISVPLMKYQYLMLRISQILKANNFKNLVIVPIMSFNEVIGIKGTQNKKQLKSKYICSCMY